MSLRCSPSKICVSAAKKSPDSALLVIGLERDHGLVSRLMGIGTILGARHCLLPAFGRNKARAIAHAVDGPVTSTNPASALQLHPEVTVFLDEPAASKLKLRRDYRSVYERKPDWQKF